MRCSQSTVSIRAPSTSRLPPELPSFPATMASMHHMQALYLHTPQGLHSTQHAAHTPCMACRIQRFLVQRIRQRLPQLRQEVASRALQARQRLLHLGEDPAQGGADALRESMLQQARFCFKHLRGGCQQRGRTCLGWLVQLLSMLEFCLVHALRCRGVTLDSWSASCNTDLWKLQARCLPRHQALSWCRSHHTLRGCTAAYAAAMLRPRRAKARATVPQTR